ncbi:MAG: phytanoyl-CoA dioxygenase family protein [Rhodospirillales bacterium]
MSDSQNTYPGISALSLTKYHELGYHIEPDIWLPEEQEEILEAAKNLPTAHNGTFHITQNPHLKDDLKWIVSNPKIVAIMEQLLGGRLNAIQSQFFFVPPAAIGYTAHQDNFYVQSYRDSFASAWSAMEDVDPENGGLYIYPRSHLEEILPVADTDIIKNASYNDIHVTHQSSVLPEGRYQKLDLFIPRGSVVFIHGHLVHGSYPNTSHDRFRRSLLVTYLRQGAPFRKGRDNKRQITNCYDAR